MTTAHRSRRADSHAATETEGSGSIRRATLTTRSGHADHPPAVPAFRKLDAVAVLTARLLPAPQLAAAPGPRTDTGSAGAAGRRRQAHQARRPAPARHGGPKTGHQARGRAPGPRTGTRPEDGHRLRRRGGPRTRTSSPPPHRAEDGHRTDDGHRHQADDGHQLAAAGRRRGHRADDGGRTGPRTRSGPAGAAGRRRQAHRAEDGHRPEYPRAEDPHQLPGASPAGAVSRPGFHRRASIARPGSRCRRSPRPAHRCGTCGRS